MNADMIKNAGSTIAAIFIVVFGMWQVGNLIAAGLISGDAGLGLLSLLIGGAATFLFNRESQTQATRSQENAIKLGASTAASTTVNATGDTTVQGGDPTNVNVKGDK